MRSTPLQQNRYHHVSQTASSLTPLGTSRAVTLPGGRFVQSRDEAFDAFIDA
jgi:hypothetical protein